MQWTLEMSMRGPHGEAYTVALPLDHHTAGEFERIAPPVPLMNSFDDAVEILRRREFRKDLFQRAARNLGTLLAETMEDKEGWHGVDRQEGLADWGLRHPVKSLLARHGGQ